MSARVDYAIVGGGLQAALIALAVRARQPAARIAIVERAARIAGNHTWCFHAQDAPAEWVEPLVVARWSSYDVAFPRHRRSLTSPYACTTSARVASVVERTVDELWLGQPAVAIEPTRVATADRELSARAVIDARGPTRLTTDGRVGWQTFVGRELIVRDHGVARPIVMDATVPQRGAFRFMYVLPLDSDRLLVEDTAFADSSYLDVAAGRAAVDSYAAARGWRVEAVEREETGILALPLALPPPSITPPLVAGYAGGWFHPVTGYSFPIAARLADHIARRSPDDLFGPELAAHAADHASQLRFATHLNRMLFNWFAPEQRYNVLERFYRLPEATIRRFYALELTRFDRAQIIIGRPPRGLDWRAVFGLSGGT